MSVATVRIDGTVGPFCWTLYHSPEEGLHILSEQAPENPATTRIICAHIANEHVGKVLCEAPMRLEQVLALSSGWRAVNLATIHEKWADTWMWIEPDGTVHRLPGADDVPPWSEDLRTILHEKYKLHKTNATD